MRGILRAVLGIWARVSLMLFQGELFPSLSGGSSHCPPDPRTSFASTGFLLDYFGIFWIPLDSFELPWIPVSPDIPSMADSL